MSNGKKITRPGGGLDRTTSLPVTTGLSSELNPTTNLPVEDDYPHVALPNGDWDMNTILREQVPLDFHTNRYDRPTIFPGNIYENDDIDWDVKDYSDINRQLARNQGTWGYIGGFLTQGVVGEIAGGIIEGIGSMMDALDGDLRDDFSHPVAGAGHWLREKAKEWAPIYQAPSSGGWNPGDPGWWAQNGVSVLSSISMMVPAYGLTRGVSLAGNLARRANMATKGLKGAGVTKAIDNALTLSRTSKWLTKSAIMGTSMRHMENYREAAETYKLSYDQTYDFFGNPAKLDAFLESDEGKRMMDKYGLEPGSKGTRDLAAKYIGGQAASKSYNMNWANLLFDVAQSALFFKGVARSTRAGMFGHTKNVKKAQNAILKNPKYPKTRIGKFLNKTKRARNFAFWSGTEGVEEIWNFISMQEGIRHGDVLSGNTGWENKDFMEGNFTDRLNRYANDGEMWTAALMGTLGGAIFTGVSHVKNMKAQKARDAEIIKEINNRVDFLRESLKKRQKAEQRGDTNGVKEQDELMALEMALNAARTGSVDLLVDMLNDPVYEELLGEHGVSKEHVSAQREKIISLVEQTEKVFNKYVNRFTGKKYSWGVANAVTNMDMTVNIYDRLIKEVEQEMESLEETDSYNQKMFSTGPNTKRRYQLKAQLQALQGQLDQLVKTRAQVAEEVTNPDATKQEKEDAKNLLEVIDKLIADGKTKKEIAEKESSVLEKDSKETYESKEFEKEQKFLNEVNTSSREYLEQRKAQFEYNRDTAWQALQDILNGKWEKDKVDQAFSTPSERDIAAKAVAEGREDIAASAESRAQEKINDGIKQDFRDLVAKNPNLTEQQIRDFFKDHQDNPVIREYGREMLKRFIKWETQQAFQDEIDDLRRQEAEIKKDIKSEIEKEFDDLRQKLFNPKLSRKQQAERIAMEEEQRKNKAKMNHWMFGEEESKDYLIKDLFDGLTPYVQVTWGDKIGMIYRDTNTKELIFRESETNKEYIVSENIHNKEFRNSKGQYTKGPTLGYLNMRMLRDSNLDIVIEADGRTFKINGEYFNNLFTDPGSAIEYDENANVVSVTLERWDGTKVTFTSPSITYELADVIETLEAVKRTRFKDLVKDDFMIIQYKGKEYILSYGSTDQMADTLIARDEGGVPLTGELNAAVLRAGNIQLTQLIQEAINNIKKQYNETSNANPNATSRLTRDAVEQDEVGPSQTLEESTKQNEAQSNAAGKTSNPSPNAEQSKDDISEQNILTDAAEKKVDENNETEETPLEEKPSTNQTNQNLQIVESTSNKESGQTTKEKSSPVETKDTPTTTNDRTLKQTFAQAFGLQIMGDVSQFGEYQTVRDQNGNSLELLVSPTGVASNIVFLDDLTGPQLEALEKNDPRFQRLYVFEPLRDSNNKIRKEGGRVLESDTLVELKIKRGDRVGPAVRVQIKQDAVPVSEIFDTKLLNDPNLGVGTKVVLRVEKNWPYFKTSIPGQGVVTVRLASNPNIILSVLSAADKSAINTSIRKKINKYIQEYPGQDIPATIAGKTNGYIINLKHKGKSIQKPISTLGDILFGIDLGGSGVNYNNTNENNFESEYTEQGYVYARIKSASGRYIPIRLQTATLTDEAINKILDTLTSNGYTAEDKRLVVEQLVYIPRGKEKDAQFKLGSKTNKTFAVDFDISMDNFVIKFPFRNKVIGIQYNMEGREGNARNNLSEALEGGEFLYKEYDQQGNIIPLEGQMTGQSNNIGKRNTLRNSSELNLISPTEIKDALINHLKGKVFNIQKHKINTKEEYLSPLRDTAFANYDAFLSEMNILTTDIPGQGEQQFVHSRLYLDIKDTVFTPAEKQVPEFLKDSGMELTEVPAAEEEQGSDQPNLNEILGGEPVIEKEEDTSTKRVDPSNDTDFDVKLRRYDELTGAYDIMSETEKAWVLERFGEEALDVVNRAKYLILKDGRQAWGYYHQGLMTVAEGAMAGTAYWEAFRRIYDLHLTPEEKATIELEALDKYGQNADIETKLAEEFMNYQLTENATGFGAAVKRFFKELLYHIKNMIGMGSEIEYLFRDLNNREFTKYSAEEAKQLTQNKAPKLRAKQGYNSDQSQEIVGNINMTLAKALKAKYAKKAAETTGITELERDQIKEGWRDALTKPTEIRGAYESIRQQWTDVGLEKSKSEDTNEKNRGLNVLDVTKQSVWYDVVDEFGNVTSPGFQSLAIRGLRSQFGVKYQFNRKGEVNYNNPVVEDPLTEVEQEEVETQPTTKERLFGVNFYNTPIKQTLSKDIKFELGFIVERNRKGEVIYGEILGMPKYMPFDEVYAYLSVNLANTPRGKVVSKLQKLAENGHHMMDQVLKIYGAASKQWQNKFVSHFNKQNIRFETVILSPNGTVKIVETNRNNLEKQIINKWVDTRDQTEIYSPVTGKEDALSPAAIDKLKTLYDKTTLLARQKAEKKEYLRAFKNTLDYAGIRLSDEAYLAIFNDETIQVSDLNTYMVGNSSFEHIMRALLQFNNPYLKGSAEISALKRIAGLDASFRIDNYAASFLSGAKKPIYAINLNTYDSKKTLELRSDETYEQTILNRFRDTFYSPTEENRHIILDLLLNNEEVRNNFHLSTFDVIREASNGGKTSDYSQLSESLSAVTRLVMFFNSGLHYGKFNTGTKGDKNQSKYLTLPKIGPRSRFRLWRSNKLGQEGLVETAVNLLRPAVLGELARIAKVNNQLFGPNPIALHEQKKNIHYLNEPGDNKGQGLKFVQFPSLNTEQFFTEDGRLIQALVNAESMDNISMQQALITTHLQKYVINEMDATIQTLVDIGVVNKTLTGKYENELLPTAFFEGKTHMNTGILPALQEFAINELVYKPYISTTFGPDLAYYKPDKAGNPIIEAGKRAYQTITPGVDAVWNEDKQYGLPSNFTHAILADVIIDSESHILKILADANVDSKTAKRIAAAYKKVNSTDAQGYTTLEFHKKQMESDGSWTAEHDIAYEKYWSKGLMGDAKARALLLDPRKTYYYGERLEVDSQGNQNIVWEQIKHSTIPLLREFTEQFKEEPAPGRITLNQLRIRMEDKSRPIDMVNFESGVKIGAMGILDVSKDQNLDTIPVNVLNTENLRSPQIIETKLKNPLDGTQMAKLSIANIIAEANYNIFGGKMSGKQIVDLYNEAYAERINRSVATLNKKLGIESYMDAVNNRNTMSVEAYNKAELDFLMKVRDVVVNSLEERDLPDNYYNALNIERLINDVNSYGFEAPLSFPPFAKRFEAILLSLYKNAVLKQRFNGLNAVQVAEFGWNIDKRLQIKPHKNGGVYAEVALPYQLATKIGLKPGEVVKDSDIYDLIGYRIPTQGKNSMLSLKVVKILPENMGGVIMLPAEITTMMGSDFDIDKMYIMMPELSKENTKIGAFDVSKYNDKKSFEGLSDKALTNILFDIRQAIITSRHHIVEQLDPLDSPTYANKVKEYEEKGLIPNLSNMNINSLTADLYLEKINKEAGMLIGIFSLHATGHSLAQQMGLKINDEYAINFNAGGKKRHTSLSNIEGFDGKYISTYLSEDQNESLDNAKHQRIGRVGVTVFNSGVVALLNRAGFNNSITLDFINQPILRQFFEKRAKAEPQISDQQIAKEIANTYALGIEFDQIQKGEVIFTPTENYLSESLTANLMDAEVARKQIQILADYLRYSKVGRDLNMFNSAVSPETMKNMSRLSFIENYNNKVEYLMGPGSSLTAENSTKRVEAYRQGIQAAVDFVSQFVPYNRPGFMELKRSIAYATGQRNGILTPELSDVINAMGLFWSLTKKNSPFGSMLYEQQPVLKKLLFTKEESLLKHMERIKRDNNLQNDPFLGMLFGHESNINVDNFLQLIAFNNTTKLGVDQYNIITDRWRELLVDPRKEVRTLAQNLIKYSVMTSGFMMGPNSFVDLVPMSYWKSSGLTDFFRREERTMNYENYFSSSSAAEQIIRNIFTEPGLLMTIDNKTVETSDQVRKNYQLSNNEYFVHRENAPQLVTEQEDGGQAHVTYFKSFIGEKFRLFKLRYATETGAVYKEITPLGERFKHVEMQADNVEVEGINPHNTLRFEQPVPDKVTLNNKIEGEQSDLLQLEPEVKQAVLNELDQRIEQWLMENFGIPVEKYNNLRKKLGIDAIGVADMINKVVKVDNERDRFTLPEEAGHFYIEMMETPAQQRLLELVTQTKTYQQVLEDYKHIYNNPKDFQKEAAGKILAKYIVGEYVGDTVTEDYGTGLMGTLRKLWQAIKRFFGGRDQQINDLNKGLTEILGPAASAIISGVNPGGLNIDNIGVNKYYALNSKNKILEFRNSKGEVLTPSDLLRRGAQAASSKVPYLRQFTEKDKMEKLIDENTNIIAPTENSPYYEIDGVKMNRVSRVMEIFQEPFAQQEMAEKVAQVNRRNKNEFDTADKVQDLWDFLRDDMGTGLHTLVQGIIEKSNMDTILDGLPQGHREAFKSAIPSLRDWVRTKEAAGSTLYSEVRIGDKQDLLAGTVDVIEVTPSGKKILHDFKTKVRGKFGDISKKLPNFKGPLSGIQNTLLNKYRIQLSLYKHIIEEKGIKIDGLNVVPIEADVSIDNNGDIFFTNAAITTETTPVYNKLKELESIPQKTIRRMIDYIAPNHESMMKTDEYDRVLKVFDKAKNQLEKKIKVYSKEPGNNEYANRLTEIFNEMEEINEKEGLVLYVKRAITDLNSAHRRLNQLKKDNALNARVLNQIKDFVSAYNILEEITLLAPLLAESGYTNLIEKYIMPAIAKRDLILEDYKGLARSIIAETFADLAKNPAYAKNPEKFLDELTVGGRDISFLSRWLDALGNTNDPSLQLVDKMVTIQRGKVNKAEYDFMHGEGALMDLLTKLEKFQNSQGVSIWRYKELYDFMLEKDQEGRHTGGIVQQYTPEFRQAQNKFKNEKLDNGFALSEIQWNEFYREDRQKNGNFNKWLVGSPESYISDKFTALTEMSETDPRRVFYHFYENNMKLVQSYLPNSYRRGYMLPSLRATTAERALMNKDKGFFKGSYDAIKEGIGEMFGQHEDNVMWGEYTDAVGDPVSYVPVHYSARIGTEEGMLSPSDLSYDVASSLKMYFTMATNFHEMQQIMPEIEAAKELIRTRRVRKLRAGMPVKDQLTGEDVTIAGVDSRAWQRLEDYFNMVVYGKRKKHEGAISLFGKEYNMEQIGDALLQLGSLRVLALNDKAGVANITFGTIMNATEAFAGQHFNMKEWAEAKGYYYGHTGADTMGNPGLIADTLSRAPKSKIGQLNQLYNVQQEFDEYGNRLSHRKMGLRMNQGALYFMMSAGEHMISTQIAIAMMLNTKFETSKGKTNLYKAYSIEKGKLVLDPEVAAQFSEVDRILLSEKIQAVYQRLHGIYNTKDRNALQQYAVGRWAMQFRKWMRPGYLRRFEGAEKLFYKKDSEYKGPEYNERLQSYVEGNYVTAVKFIGQLGSDIKRLKFWTMRERYNELEPWQRANIKRSLGEAMAFQFLTLMGVALFGMDDDPEDRSGGDWYGLYVMKRVQAELLFYNPLGSSFYEILRTPAANMTTIEAYSDLLSQVWDDGWAIIFGNDVERYKRKTGRYEKGDAKINKYIRNVLPFKEWGTDPKDKIKFFDLK